MKIAITGHRPHKLGGDYDLKSPLIKWIKEQIINNIILSDPQLQLISGMALGIDTLFAQIAIEYNIPFIAAIPFEGQHNRWFDKSKKLYFELINHPLCTKHYVSIGNYSQQMMQLRNEWMVDNCDLLIAVWDG